MEKTYITHHDRIVLSAYTGVLMCDITDLQKFIETVLGHPVFTHELVNEEIQEELREKLKPEFLRIVGESDVEPVRPGRWQNKKSPWSQGGYMATCSWCHESIASLSGKLNFCPNCGAKMVKEFDNKR